MEMPATCHPPPLQHPEYAKDLAKRAAEQRARNLPVYRYFYD